MKQVVTPKLASSPSFRIESHPTRRAERLAITLQLRYHITLVEYRLDGVSQTTNVSSGGVQFAVSQMVAPASRCDLALILDNPSDPIRFQGHVAWCRQTSSKPFSHYEIGVTFATPESGDDQAFARYCRFIASQLLAQYLT